MDITPSFFKRKIVNPAKLLVFGFIKNKKGTYLYRTLLLKSGFEMTVCISESGGVTAEVIDPALSEPYTLHLTDGASGDFVIGVKTEYEALLGEIAEKCFEPDVFTSEQAKELIDRVRREYSDEPEYLWEKFPGNAVWRRRDNRKWYGALLTVSAEKLGIESGGLVEILDLRIKPDEMDSLIDRKSFFPGWHMNKKNWFTILLDGRVSTEDILEKIAESHRLALK